MITSNAPLGLTPAMRDKIDRELDGQDCAQALACSRGLHPTVVRGHCPFCNRKVTA